MGLVRAVQGRRARYVRWQSSTGNRSAWTSELTSRPDSHMARDSFGTFIPLSVDNDAKSSIIFDFFDLLAAIVAHSKTNGFSGRKLSRAAAWWAFEHNDNGNGFEGGYKSWLRQVPRGLRLPYSPP